MQLLFEFDANPPTTEPVVATTDPPGGDAEPRPDPPGAVEFVRHPRARRYLIRVRLDGSVRVTIPRRGSKREAAAFLEQQRPWVAAQQQRVSALRQRLPTDLPAEEQRALRARAARELPARLLELAARVGLTVRKVSVRNQRHRWGSCSPSGLICLNWRLVAMPAWVRDYVLYHELVHLEHMDHSPAFWARVAELCPEYQQARRWLRRHALAPHAPDAHADPEFASTPQPAASA
jgi:predicted metal-dependent hydrolase